jgi:hypothetical protein
MPCSVNGHESAPVRTIADLLAALKSDQSAAGPVSRTVTCPVAIRARASSTRPAASTIARGGAPARPVTIAVRWSGAIVPPSRGMSTPATAGSRRSVDLARASTLCIAGS